MSSSAPVPEKVRRKVLPYRVREHGVGEVYDVCWSVDVDYSVSWLCDVRRSVVVKLGGSLSRGEVVGMH